MKRIKLNSLILVIITLVTSCGKEDIDIVAPAMEIVELLPNPVIDEVCGTEEPVVFQLKGGDELTFDVVFSDNAALSQYKVDIHNNFDCHGHGGGSAPSIIIPNISNQTTDWSILDIQDISGQNVQVMRSFQVPENVTAGNYHYYIQVIDESGNDSPFANFYALKIKNPFDKTAPEIKMQAPLKDSKFSTKKGSTINFIGTVTDDRSLSDGGNGILYLAYTDLSSGNTFSTDKAFPFDENVDKSFEFDFEYAVPQTLVEGSYRFSLGANDGVRNVAAFAFFDVEVTN